MDSQRIPDGIPTNISPGLRRELISAVERTGWAPELQKAAVRQRLDPEGWMIVRESLEAAMRWLAVELEMMIKNDPYENDRYLRSETMNENAVRSGFNKAVQSVRRIFSSPPNNAHKFIAKLTGYTFSPEEAAEIKVSIDTATHPRTVSEPTAFVDEHYRAIAYAMERVGFRPMRIEQDGLPRYLNLEEVTAAGKAAFDEVARLKEELKG